VEAEEYRNLIQKVTTTNMLTHCDGVFVTIVSSYSLPHMWLEASF
jgi:hypothetical protein